MVDSEKSWKKWGEIDPYYGVLSDDKFRKSSIDDNLDDFFQSGKDYVEGRISKIENHFGPIEKKKALDFGCGVGRLAFPLSENFASVTGVDISPAMLDEARRISLKTGNEKVEFLLASEFSKLQNGQFDYVNSYIVIQHIETSKGMEIIQKLGQLVADGGALNIHFSVFRNDTKSQKLRYLVQKSVPGANSLINLAAGRAISEPLMQMNEYSLPQILMNLNNLGFKDFIIDTEYHGRILTVNVASVKKQQV